MKINNGKRIGRVLYIVEGSKTEFSILKKIFCNILNYSYVEKRRNRLGYFVSEQDSFSRVAVINTKESNIRFISEDDFYLDSLFVTLLEKYNFPVEQSAIYYLFDRDPESNTDSNLIKRYIKEFANPYDNEEGFKPGQLLLSYPSIESFVVSNFKNNSCDIRFELGKDLKKYIAANTDIQLNKINDETLVNAANEFFEYLKCVKVNFDVDSFSNASAAVFDKQEMDYLNGRGYSLFSMLTLSLLQLGILEI